jgi:hypothetical protein
VIGGIIDDGVMVIVAIITIVGIIAIVAGSDHVGAKQVPSRSGWRCRWICQLDRPGRHREPHLHRHAHVGVGAGVDEMAGGGVVVVIIIIDGIIALDEGEAGAAIDTAGAIYGCGLVDRDGGDP